MVDSRVPQASGRGSPSKLPSPNFVGPFWMETAYYLATIIAPIVNNINNIKNVIINDTYLHLSI